MPSFRPSRRSRSAWRILVDDRGAKLDRQHEGRRHRQTERRHPRQVRGLGADRVGGMLFGRYAADTHDMPWAEILEIYADRSVMMCRRNRCPNPASRSVARSMARASSSTESEVATSKPPANTRVMTSRSRASAACSASIRRIDGVERVFGIGAASFRDFDGGGKPGSRGFRRGRGDRAEFGKRRQQRRIDARRRQRGDEGGLFQFVDGLLDAVHQLFDDRAGVEAGRFLARFEGDAIRLAFDPAGAAPRAACRRSDGPPAARRYDGRSRR